MNTATIKFSEAGVYMSRSPLSELWGKSPNGGAELELWELDQNAPIGLGAFSKPRSKIMDSLRAVVERLRDIRTAGEHSDMLIKYVEVNQNRGFQLWERRKDTGVRDCSNSSGSRMPRKGCGIGLNIIR